MNVYEDYMRSNPEKGDAAPTNGESEATEKSA